MNFTALERAIIIAAIAAKKLDDANPDVGFSVGNKYFLDQLLDQAKIKY